MEVVWWKSVWLPQPIQKHAFMEWLTLKNRLTTKSRPIQWGFFGDNYCAFCRNKIESREHLYFECSFTKRDLEACDGASPSN